ncbi:MAG: hypothetical protein ABSC55_24480, partial [Syntrophorhabdales bacterium]
PYDGPLLSPLVHPPMGGQAYASRLMTVCLQEYSFVASALSHYDVLKYASVRHGLSASLYL